jgi:hypothetical protein
VFLPHSLRAICDGPCRVRGLSSRIRRFKARVAGYQHAYAQAKDRRCKDRRKDGGRAIEEEESDQGSDHRTGNRAKESTEGQPASEPPVHPSLGRALSSTPTLAPRFGCTFLHERCDTRAPRLEPRSTPPIPSRLTRPVTSLKRSSASDACALGFSGQRPICGSSRRSSSSVGSSR